MSTWPTAACSGSADQNQAGLQVARYELGERRIVRDVVLGSSFGSSEDPRLHFGLGDAARVESVEVRWPFGATQRFGPLDAGHLFELVEGRDGARMLR